MYVVRVVQGVHNRMMQPMGQAHAQAPAHGAGYSKESCSVSSGRTTVVAIQGQLTHRAACDTLTTRSAAAAGPPVMTARPCVITSPAHRVTTAAGMISCLWRPLRYPPALTVHPSSSSRAQLMIHRTLDGSRSSAVIHLPQKLTGSSSSRRLIAAHTAAVLPLPPPAAVRSAAWAVQRRFVPASSVLIAAAAAGARRERSLQHIAAAQGYQRGNNSSNTSKILIRRSRSVVLLPAKYVSSGGANFAAPRSAPAAAAATAPAAASSSARWCAHQIRAQGAGSSSSSSSSSRPASVDGHGAGNTGAAGGAAGSSGSGPPRLRPASVAAAAADGTGGFLALPTASIKLARMGIALMGLAAAAALAAVFLSESRKSEVTDDLRSDQPAAAAAAAAMPMHNKVSGSSGAESYEGPVYYAWMEKRLQSALQQFDREQDMLHAEMAMLQTLGKKVAGSSSSAVTSGRDAVAWTDRSGEDHNRLGILWSKLKGWFGRSSSSSDQPSSSSSSSTPPAAAAGMSAQAISTRMVEIRDQIESLDVLRAALTAELLEQQQQQQRVDVQQMSKQYATLADGQ